MASPGPTRRELLPPRILVVDNDDRVCRSLRRALERAGYAVVTAASGSEALARAEAWPPCCVVLERSLPDMDGMLLAQALRGRLGSQAVPTIMMTADPGVVAEGPISASFDKPYDVRELLELLGELTHRPRRHRAA